ncbi:GNAT family N-acetyltransferase [Thermococcus gorgonarius]|uniref:GNAT family acetyltransferase n=1 Tax=Thermococcus gorgonarius TaxID=71997 RepID=A0A2Z2M920_THEGO|nr:GNAT family N-acetyltransferase [Thermococcus gorgonarius]ASJ00404.1 GNAT family acetyltransferase [Thermococcus gorgonarius]
MVVRRATLDDVKSIVHVHTAGEDLSAPSVRERYLRGGPWMSVETCSVHLNNLLLEGQLPVVAEVEEKIVGEAEVLFSEEPAGGKTRRIAHLDVIEVHPDFRGRGIGRALVGFIEKAAREREAEFITTQPDEEALGFYRKLGFDEVLYNGLLVEIHTEEFEPVDAKPLQFFPWEAVKSLQLVAGRFQSSYGMWFSSFRDVFAGIHEVAEAGKAGESYYVLKPLPGRLGKASLFLWGREEDIPKAIARARGLGFEKVLTVLDEETAEALGAEKKGKVQIIGKRLP